MHAWERQREKHRSYARRKPESTPLYCIVSACHEVLASCWEDIFQSDYGALRNEVLKAFNAYLSCGILVHGCARVRCENKDCNHSELIAFSCKTRCLCPSCAAKSAVLFAENLVENVLLPFPHRHCVFTVPKRIRPFFKFKRDLMAILYRTAWESWKELAFTHFPTGTPAAIEALHTAGDLLSFNSHLHGAIANGVFLADGSFKPFVHIDTEAIQELFQNSVLASLRTHELIDDGTIEQMLSQEHSGFSVWFGEPFDDAESERFVARY